MRALDRKLARDMRQIWAQSLAIALVMACGAAVLVMSFGTLRNLGTTRDAYYERNRFADVFVAATRAPLDLLPEIAALEGVARLEARISGHIVLDMPQMQEPGMARVVSLPRDGEPVLNVPLLRQGRLPDPLAPDEVALSAPFAAAHGLRPGDGFRAIMGGQLRDLRVSGIAMSPEFIYTIAPGSIFPDDRRFGIFWMGHDAAAAAFDLDGAFNDLALALTPAALARPVIDALDELLRPFGGTGAHDRDLLPSHSLIQQELDQLRVLAWLLPPVFFVVSAFLVNMVLGRLIALERQQIGLMKAVGYSAREIAAHYLKMAGVIGLAGVLIGWVAGYYIAEGMTRLYGEYFQLPYLINAPSTSAFAISGVMSMLTVALGAIRAILATVRLSPAVAMSPPAPPKFSQGAVDRLGRGFRLRQTTMMILRSVTRWPGRAAITLCGVAASVTVLIGSFFFFDAVEVMMDEMFTLSNRQQVTLTLAQAQTLQAVIDAHGLPGVLSVEGAFATPVRLRHGTRESLLPLQARAENPQLARVLGHDGQPLALPPEGLVLPEVLARNLDAREGDLLVVEFFEGARETHLLPVASVVRQTLGEAAYIRDGALFSLLGQEPRVNQLHLLVDTAQVPALYAQVKQTPAIGGVSLWSEIYAQLREQMDQSLFTAVFIYAMLGVLITVGVVYNAARIQLSERAYELASLRVLGFSRGEVSYVLVGEIMLLTVLALPLGWAAGYGFAAMSAQSMSSELVNMPFVVSKRTVAGAMVLAFVSALVSVLMVRRRLDRVDLVSALKKKE